MNSTKKILILAFIFIISNCFSQTFRGSFDALDANLINGNGFSFYINIDGGLQANEATVMESYITMYKATKDKHYLDKFIIHAKRVQNNRDNDADYYRVKWLKH